MSILLSFDLDERRKLAADELAPLARALRAELEPLINGSIPFPQQKAQLTRVGGRCSFDGTYLNFDPYSPHEHQCRQCHRVFMDRAHDDWWAMGAQLWVAERAAQAAALNLISNDSATSTLALRILNEMSDRYASWPNRDNALGPTRPFFSTYLESIWLLNLCHAIALLEQAGVDASGVATLDRVRENLVRPSRDLIAVFHEGRSNRQVWNEVAILSASRILGDEGTITRRLDADGGLFDLFANGLLDDGTWYEGENYHLFAHRGLWYGVQLLRALNRPLPDALEARYRAGFVTPFLGVLPDDTLPSRRDSQYKVSVRQWRFAEWCELGISHAMQQPGARADERLIGTLHRLYNADSALALEPQHRHQFSTADAERNEPAGLLSRADLSWRALLVAVPELPKGSSWTPGSVCLPRQGLAVLRRERGDMYIALEGGHTGGGHGHPDRLALTLQHNHSRWLEDPGTGSYVDPTLHWYRSTLAHAAPLIDGASQDAVPAELLAFEDRGGAGWMCKLVENVKPGVNIQRTIVACDGYLIDLLEWDADRAVQIDLPVARHVASSNIVHWRTANAGGAGGLEDGFDFLDDVELGERPADVDAASAASNSHSFMFRTSGDIAASVQYVGTVQTTPWRAMAPGSPGQEPAPLYWLRMHASSGSLVAVWSWPEVSESNVTFACDQTFEIVVVSGETEATHTRTPDGWHIALKARHATSSMDLTYLPRTIVAEQAASRVHAKSTNPSNAINIPLAPQSVRIELGRNHYLRTEQSWEEADRPSAVANISVHEDNLVIQLSALTGEIVVPTANAENRFDNERADVNADGVELFVGAGPGAPWTASWLAVPANAHENLERANSEVRSARITTTTAASPTVHCTWEPLNDATRGYTMQITVALRDIPVQPDGTFAMELIVNERPVDRARRRGMLVLSGGEGFAYLRGDRADSADALTFSIVGI